MAKAGSSRRVERPRNWILKEAIARDGAPSPGAGVICRVAPALGRAPTGWDGTLPARITKKQTRDKISDFFIRGLPPVNAWLAHAYVREHKGDAVYATKKHE
jgi:hypothetical protein